MLPNKLSRHLLCCYHSSAWSLSPPKLLPHFLQWLSTALGLGSAHVSSQNSDVVSGRRGFSHLALDASIFHRLPALRLLQSESVSLEEDRAAMETVPLVGKYKVTVALAESLVEHKETIALALHLVYEVRRRVGLVAANKGWVWDSSWGWGW